jgi:hypothetical protein
MPDYVLILEAAGAAAAWVAALGALGAWLGRAARPAWASAGGVLGVGIGFLAGCWVLGVRPHWPPREDQDRLLLVLWPAAVGVELVAVVLGTFHGLVWAPRVVVASLAAWVLLYQSSYLADLVGPGSREWTPAQAGLILSGLAVILLGVWAASAMLVRRQTLPQPERWQGFSVVLALALACVGAAVTVMLSGYATGGQLGLPLAGALAGAVAASLLTPKSPNLEGVVGLGVVGLFALLVIGCFFGGLTRANAALLFFAPLLGWLPELPYARRMGPLLRGGVRVALTVVPVAVAFVLAQQKFVADSERTSPGAPETTIQDYLDFGK